MSKNKFDMFKYQMTNSGTDIICLSETWLNDALTTNILDIPGYRLARLDRSWRENNCIKKGGGLCMYIKQNISFNDSDACNFNISSKDIEIQWMILKFPKMREMIIANVYRPLQGNVKSFCKYLKKFLNEIDCSKKKDIFVTGDFNINIQKKSSTESKDIMNMMISFGFKQYINKPTRLSNNLCIDLMFTNCDNINQSGTLDLNYSDHQAIFITKKEDKY